MTDVVTSYRRGGRECICVPDPEDINGGMRDDCLIHGDFDSGEVEHICDCTGDDPNHMGDCFCRTCGYTYAGPHSD